MSDFDAFWGAYPKKVAKRLARVAFDYAIKKTTVETMLRTLAWQVTSDEWRRGYVPHPETWLAQERWDDEPMAPKLNARNARQVALLLGDTTLF